jgi:hypothetical protein
MFNDFVAVSVGVSLGIAKSLLSYPSADETQMKLI